MIKIDRNAIKDIIFSNISAIFSKLDKDIIFSKNSFMCENIAFTERTERET